MKARLNRQPLFVMTSSERLLNMLTEVNEPAEMMHPPVQASIATDPFCLQGEIRPEALGASTNTYQPVLVFATSNRDIPDSLKTTV